MSQTQNPTETFMHELHCPLCAEPYRVLTRSALGPPAVPCGRCWSTLDVQRRAPFLKALRSVPAPARALAHRDPVVYAPPTLQAYVEHLEAALARAEARVSTLEDGLARILEPRRNAA